MRTNLRQGAVEEVLMVELAKRGDDPAFGQLWLCHHDGVSIKEWRFSCPRWNVA